MRRRTDNNDCIINCRATLGQKWPQKQSQSIQFAKFSWGSIPPDPHSMCVLMYTHKLFAPPPNLKCPPPTLLIEWQILSILRNFANSIMQKALNQFFQSESILVKEYRYKKVTAKSLQCTQTVYLPQEVFCSEYIHFQPLQIASFVFNAFSPFCTYQLIVLFIQCSTYYYIMEQFKPYNCHCSFTCHLQKQFELLIVFVVLSILNLYPTSLLYPR